MLTTHVYKERLGAGDVFNRGVDLFSLDVPFKWYVVTGHLRLTKNQCRVKSNSLHLVTRPEKYDKAEDIRGKYIKNIP